MTCPSLRTVPSASAVNLLGLVGALLLSAGCASVPPVGAPTNTLVPTEVAPDQIRWPERYRPEEAGFTIRNKIEIAAPPQVVWDLLMQAKTWPTWYEGASDVEIEGGDGETIGAGSVFRWRTMGQALTTRVVEFEPPFRLGWETRKSTLKAYHAWLFVPTARGVRVVTEESQYGLLAGLQSAFQPNKLRRLHDVWLAELRKRAEAGG
jgi:uncharacterized protein YndB with AHSA1/START domain